ncbi:MAG TPA: response regulator transcription factor [Caldilineaceae bacterium]|nr:response regulator transcription factor [Caldilineaceae bacterium]
MDRSIRVLIADDHAIVRKGLRTLITSQADMEVVAEAVNGIEAVLKARATQPDVILMDMVMPRQDGASAIREIKQENPEARILVLTSFAEDDKIFPAIKSGALGYLLKDAETDQLLHAIRDVSEGKSSLDPTVALRVIHELNHTSDLPPTEDPLTSRELEVLQLVAQGLTNQEIADRLILGERTVGNHISSILSKLHLANRTQAALYALREGIAPLHPMPAK